LIITGGSVLNPVQYALTPIFPTADQRIATAGANNAGAKPSVALLS